MNSNDYYTRLPEWDLTPDQINALITYYNERQHKLKQYITKSGRAQELWLLYINKRIPVMQDMLNSLPFDRNCYFISNTGIDRHVDDGRSCTISWCIQGEHAGPTLFWDSDTTDVIADECHYTPGGAVLLNTTRWHSSPFQTDLRVFFQIELAQNISYENHRDILI